MSYGAKQKYTGDMLDGVLPQYERISKAPSSITDISGFWEIAKQFPDKDQAAKERDKFEDRFLAQERKKLYKAMNYNTGEVFLIQNPICREIIYRAGVGYVQRIEPKKMGHIDDLKNNAPMIGYDDEGYNL